MNTLQITLTNSNGGADPSTVPVISVRYKLIRATLASRTLSGKPTSRKYL